MQHFDTDTLGDCLWIVHLEEDVMKPFAMFGQKVGIDIWAFQRLDKLDLHRSGEIELSPPTFITLVQLAEATDITALLAGRGHVEHFATRIEGDGDDLVAIYHGDAAYETGDLAAPGGRHRLIMSSGGWVYLRDA